MMYTHQVSKKPPHMRFSSAPGLKIKKPSVKEGFLIFWLPEQDSNLRTRGMVNPAAGGTLPTRHFPGSARFPVSLSSSPEPLLRFELPVGTTKASSMGPETFLLSWSRGIHYHCAAAVCALSHRYVRSNVGLSFHSLRYILGSSYEKSQVSYRNLAFMWYGSRSRTRTCDMVVNSHPLYQLSYPGISAYL